MKVRIIETGKFIELNIVDPKSGCNWAADLMGNHNALGKYDDENDCYELEQDVIDWWQDLMSRYQTADNRYYELLQELGSYDAGQLEIRMSNVCCDDLEVIPNLMQEICDEYELSGSVNKDGNIDVFINCWPATQIDYLVVWQSIYPVGSDFSCNYEHPAGITITPEDAEKVGLKIED